jgi:hypothetical protein
MLTCQKNQEGSRGAVIKILKIIGVSAGVISGTVLLICRAITILKAQG